MCLVSQRDLFGIVFDAHLKTAVTCFNVSLVLTAKKQGLFVIPSMNFWHTFFIFNFITHFILVLKVLASSSNSSENIC